MGSHHCSVIDEGKPPASAGGTWGHAQEWRADTAGASEIVFALSWALGYRYAPRLADLADHRLWFMAPVADYGPLNGLAPNRINTALIISQW